MIAKSFTITGDGAAHTFASALGLPPTATSFQVKWLIGAPKTGNSANVLVGGNEVSSTVGFPLPAGSSLFFPDISELSSRYELFQEYYYAANGDVLYCLYGVD